MNKDKEYVRMLLENKDQWLKWDQENTAWYEAGHAVAYLDRGYVFEYVTIVETAWKIGYVQRGPGQHDRPRGLPLCSRRRANLRVASGHYELR